MQADMAIRLVEKTENRGEGIVGFRIIYLFHRPYDDRMSQ
jgi:hypothetical protein